MVHRNSGGRGKMPFGQKVIYAFLLIVLAVIVAYVWGSH